MAGLWRLLVGPLVVVMILAAATMAGDAAKTVSEASEDQKVPCTLADLALESAPLHGNGSVILLTTDVKCRCSVADITVECPGWTQDVIDPSFLAVNGDGTCNLWPLSVLLPSSTYEALYAGPPRPLTVKLYYVVDCPPP